MDQIAFTSPWMDSEQAGTYLGVKPKTLVVWRSQGKGPRYRIAGGRLVRYHSDDLDAFVTGDADE